MMPVRAIVKALSSYYQASYLGSLVLLLQRSDYQVARYLGRYWSTQSFDALAADRPTRTPRNVALLIFVFVGALLQVVTGLSVLVYGLNHDLAGSLLFGLALIISYPVVWAHLLAIFYVVYKLLWAITHPKVFGRNFVCSILEQQVVQLRRTHQFTVIAVAGSVGKTSTKLAIAHALEPTRRVIYQTGNYNDRVTVPLVLFGQKLPNLLNAVAWAKIFWHNAQTIKRPFFYDIAVLEIGTDHPGQMAKFAYLKPDITVLTALTPEHMEYFGSLDAVAAEELAVCEYSKQVLINADDTPAKYRKDRTLLTFGMSHGVDFRAIDYRPQGLKGSQVKLQLRHGLNVTAQATILGAQGVKILLAAASVAQLAGLEESEIKKGLTEIKPFAGRMQILMGIKGCTIIDDTYNASPVAVEAALDVLYAAPAPQRIAILGNMNELGGYSPEAHTEVGNYCRPDKLYLVVTIGSDAEKYLAPAARAKGCTVESYSSPYEAGNAVQKQLTTGAVVLAEGSQNGVFAEEALKVLLTDVDDEAMLVRQSKYWLNLKRAQFQVLPISNARD